MKAGSPVDVVGVGLNSLDTLICVPHFPASDSKLAVLSSEVRPGGQVASAIVACQRWGLQSRYVGKIGDDPAGRFQREEFAREGVEAHWVEVPDCPSQSAFILIDQSTGERTILWQRDPRLDFRHDEIEPQWATSARILHVDGHPCRPAEVAARWARETGVTVTADLDSCYPGVEALLEHVDHIVGSREFPERLLGIQDLLEALPEIVKRFHCRTAGATLGRDGVLAWDGQQFHYLPAFGVDAVDTTGAGDIFHAGFVYGLLQAWPLDRTLEFSCAAAALNCTALGARGCVRPVAEIEQFIRRAPRRAAAFDAKELRERSARARAVQRSGMK